MTAELWQFGIMLAVFCAVLVLWLKIIYLPRRTMERWEAPDPAPKDPVTHGPREMDDDHGS